MIRHHCRFSEHVAFSRLAINSGIQTRDASGNILKILQEFECTVSLNGLTKQLHCYVTSNADLNIIGLDWVNEFNLWKCSSNSFCDHIAYPSSNHIHKFQLDTLKSSLRFSKQKWVAAPKPKSNCILNQMLDLFFAQKDLSHIQFYR